MSPFDSHPEALLDRQARGLLDSEEIRLLEEHLAKCPACALHQSARVWFAGELGERPGDDEANLALIEHALREATRRPLGIHRAARIAAPASSNASVNLKTRSANRRSPSREWMFNASWSVSRSCRVTRLPSATAISVEMVM